MWLHAASRRGDFPELLAGVEPKVAGVNPPFERIRDCVGKSDGVILEKSKANPYVAYVRGRVEVAGVSVRATGILLGMTVQFPTLVVYLACLSITRLLLC